MNQELVPLVALFIAVVLVWGLMPLAVRLGLVDRPGGRKDHEGNTPLVGGIAMFGAFVAVALLFFDFSASLSALLTGTVILIAVGVVDDLKALTPRIRFVAQILAALIICYSGGAVLWNLGDLFFLGDVGLGFVAVPFTVFSVVGAVNAMNMADGMDGLAGGLALVTSLALAEIAWQAGLDTDLYLLLALAGILIGFLSFNARTRWRRRAKVFMGDAGSMFLGLVLVWWMIRFSQGKEAVMAPVTALWIFGLPILDTVSVMLRRILKGRSPFSPDRQHFHHVLLLAGYSVPQAVAIMLGFATLLATIGIAGQRAGVSEGVMCLGFIGLFGLYFWGMNHAWKVVKALRKVHDPVEPAGEGSAD